MDKVIFPRRAGGVALVTLAVVTLAGCRGKRLSPEQQVRSAIAGVERAVEEKDLKRVGRFVSERYRDKEGNDRQAVLGLLRLQVLRYPAIHLLVRVTGVELPGPKQARATVIAAMASLPIAAPADLPKASADLYRFELQLTEDDGEWRLESASWKPARPEDFL
jgi:hypothetical protein